MAIASTAVSGHRRDSAAAPAEAVYVAVGREVKDWKSAVLWTLQNFRGSKISLLHVHRPAQMIPFMGTKFPATKLNEDEVAAYRVLEKAKMHNALNECILYSAGFGVRVEKLDIEMDNIEQGIVALVAHHGIRRLVMGAAADKNYSRQGSMYEEEMGLNASPLPSPIATPVEKEQLKSKSFGDRQSDYKRLSNPVQDFLRRVRSANIDSRKGSNTTSSSPNVAEEDLVSRNQLDAADLASECGEISTSSPSQCSSISTSSSNEEVVGSLNSIIRVRDEGNNDGPLLPPVHEEDLSCPATQVELKERRVDDPVYNHLLQARAEAENSKREAFEESLRCRKAEANAMEAIFKAKSSESLYMGEIKRRKDMENALARDTLELKNAKGKIDEIVKELGFAMDQKTILENQIAECDLTVNKLKEKVATVVELLDSVKKQRDETLVERDIVIKEAEELRKRMEDEAASSRKPVLLSEFSYSEIEEATRNFDASLMVGEGGYGCVYRGLLRNTEVAVKVLRTHSLQGCSEFQQEVDVLTRVKHPNLVILIGACSEGSPLSWQTRIRIATEICSALIFLHSNKPYSIVHGDLKPSNILLDANFTSKLSDFGICRLIPSEKGFADKNTACWRTTPKGTFVYMDPEFLATGELTSKSDVYSFGIILLRLLTGKPAMGIVKEVEYALEKRNFSEILDESAGECPFEQAKQLAHLALRCCEVKRKNRPDLKSDIWRVLEPSKASFGSSLSFRLGPIEHAIPSYLVCPISMIRRIINLPPVNLFQDVDHVSYDLEEIMRDPHTAADGHTYEGDALRRWIDSGQDASPVTGLKLSHLAIVPNHALKSAVQEWLEQH
ncbi:hypothetical protein Syun_013179 [Stephania yunnanensis]|uniref:RING-type E3 ubiquitin transferase n=1 Tax=Stephania yunnanensis TaxID=152371 RepID=A0AAP0K1K6_9MAGN